MKSYYYIARRMRVHFTSPVELLDGSGSRGGLNRPDATAACPTSQIYIVVELNTEGEWPVGCSSPAGPGPTCDTNESPSVIADIQVEWCYTHTVA
jgi:hypothetical protein